MRLQVDMTDEMMKKLDFAFRNKKPFEYKGKKYMVQSGGEVKYIGSSKIWKSDIVLIPIEKKSVKVTQN